MTFLELCQRTAREGGVEGAISSVAAQTGMNRKIVDWVADAWTDLQVMRDWSFMRSEMNGAFTIGTQNYPLLAGTFSASDFKDFAMNALYATDANGKYILPLAEYGEFRKQTLGQTVGDQRPTLATVGPGYVLQLNARPTVATTVQADYYKRGTLLLADEDTPAMNRDWHMAIVYKALRDYAEHEESPEIQRRARRKFMGIFNEMCQVELPDFTMAPRPLAWG